MNQAVADGEASPGDLASLTDRVRLARGEQQVYGTQFIVRDGRFVACRLHEPETVDLRGALIGLGSLEAYLQTGEARPVWAAQAGPRLVSALYAEIEVWPPEVGVRS